MVQAQLVGQLPIVIVSDALSLLHTALLYSLYAFEYKWCNMGWALHARLSYIEHNWPYFLGNSNSNFVSNKNRSNFVFLSGVSWACSACTICLLFLGFGLPLALLCHLASSWVVSGCVFSLLFPLFIIGGNEGIPVTNSQWIALRLFSPVIAVSNALFTRTVSTTHQVAKTSRQQRS